MDKIVYKPLKIDLHIHSEYSKHKDGGKVNDNTVENINILLEKLKANEINLAAITDHDYFSFDLYEKLIEQEEIKFLPGVEFSIIIEEGNEVHVIAIFDDTDQEKLKNINNYLVNDKNKPDYDKDKYYSESKFLEILRKIDLDVILIAHQKNSPTSDNPSKNDLMKSGKEIFNRYINSEYFNAIELRNIKNEHFYKIYKEEHELDNLKYVTGSDCHQWAVYPQYEKGKNEKIDFTYIKSLPTFKGLKMAFTDNSRISTNDNFFSLNSNEEYLKEIIISKNEEEIILPLSKGINVIIGDNSSGKSALLHQITNNKKVPKKKQYDLFLKNYSIEVKSTLSENLYRFDIQGEIRKNMEDGKFNIISHFGLGKVIKLESTIYKEKCKNKLDKIKKYLLQENQKIQPKNLKIKSFENKGFHLNGIVEKKSFKDSSEIIDKIELILEQLNELIAILPENEKNKYGLISRIFSRTLNGFKNKQKLKEFENKKYEIITNVLTGYNDNKDKIKNSKEQEKNKYDNEKIEFIENIIEMYNYEINLNNLETDYKKPIEDKKIESKEYPIGNYKYIQKFKLENIVLDDELFNDILIKLFRKGSKLEEVLNEYSCMFDKLNGLGELEKSDVEGVLKLLETKFFEEFEKRFEVNSVVVKNEDSNNEEYSMGMNAQMYFDILKSKDEAKIYIIDQPEDDISPRALKENVLSDFKKISDSKQVIIVTHNPQFIVNLDVDNVIYIQKMSNDLNFYSGALEYENGEYSILDIISENVDGGVETIEKRWKRYGNINTK